MADEIDDQSLVIGAVDRAPPVLVGRHLDDDPGPGGLGVAQSEGLAAHAADGGATLQPSDIITTTGVMEGMYLCLAATTRPGDRVLVQSPTYFGIIEKIQFMGRVPVEVPSTPEQGVDLRSVNRKKRSLNGAWM